MRALAFAEPLAPPIGEAILASPISSKANALD